MHATTPIVLLLLAGMVAAPVLAQPDQGAASTEAAVGSVPWGSLNAEQKRALKPLSAQWRSLTGEHQRKWIALTHNFSRMSPEEQTTLQGRMGEWAQLSPAQRTQARMNYDEVRRVPADEKRAKWEEYQALPAEERERLAGDRPKAPAGVAPALRATPRSRVLRPGDSPNPSAVATSPGTLRPLVPVNRNTLLPLPPASAASASR